MNRYSMYNKNWAPEKELEVSGHVTHPFLIGLKWSFLALATITISSVLAGAVGFGVSVGVIATLVLIKVL